MLDQFKNKLTCAAKDKTTLDIFVISYIHDLQVRNIDREFDYLTANNDLSMTDILKLAESAYRMLI